MAEQARLGIDWGKARIGVAASHPGTTFAYPLGTVAAGPDELRELCALVADKSPEVIYVGLPLTLAGRHGPAAEAISVKAAELAAAVAPIQVRLVDERMSTVSASRGLGAAGRNAKAQRAVIDQAAAVEILQRALDAETREGAPTGVLA